MSPDESGSCIFLHHLLYLEAAKHSRAVHMKEPGTITRLLKSWQAGSEEAYQQIFSMTIDTLRGIAGNHLNQESDKNYSTLSLINDAFTHLAETGLVQFNDRKHFFNFFGMVMRRKVIDKARSLQTEKSGGKIETVDLAEGMTLAISPTDTEEMLDRFQTKICWQEVELNYSYPWPPELL